MEAQKQSVEKSGAAVDVVVIGGGLAGLIAAAKVAKTGRTVTVLEQSKSWGGRAATQLRGGAYFNQGAHALNCNGNAKRILQELNVPVSGRFPSPGSAKLMVGGRAYAMPTAFGSLLKTRLLTVSEKVCLARLLKAIPDIDARALDTTPLADWSAQHGGRGNLRFFLEALVRVATYAADQKRLSAGAAIDQLRLALSGNVWYLDGGWQRLIEGLQGIAAQHGAQMQNGSGVERVLVDAPGHGVTVQLKGGAPVNCRAVILAVGPEHVRNMLQLPQTSELRRWLHANTPVKAACLDLALSHLPRPDVRFALGGDESTYFSVHSAAAKLAPEGIALVHTMKYLDGGQHQDSTSVERQLESMMDTLQPGWRAHVIEQRYLPSMTAAESLPTAVEAGLRNRPGPAVVAYPSVFLAGDWVGSRGMLADAAAASAEQAAQLALGHISESEDRHDRTESFANAR